MHHHFAVFFQISTVSEFRSLPVWIIRQECSDMQQFEATQEPCASVDRRAVTEYREQQKPACAGEFEKSHTPCARLGVWEHSFLNFGIIVCHCCHLPFQVQQYTTVRAKIPDKKAEEKRVFSFCFCLCYNRSLRNRTFLQCTENCLSLRSPILSGESLVCPSSFFPCCGHTGFL